MKVGVVYWVCTCLLLFTLCDSIEGKRKPSRSGSFVVLADLHFDDLFDPREPAKQLCRPDDGMCRRHYGPIFDTFQEIVTPRFYQVGRYGCDASELLVGSAFHYVREMLVDEPDFVIVLGDWAAHCKHNYASVLDIVEYISDKLEKALPKATIIPVLGNNDLYPHNSMIAGPSKYLSQLADIWGRWLPPQSKKEFATAGYYSIKPAPGFRMLAMNTLFYYTKYCPFNTTDAANGICKEDSFRPAGLEADPGGQFRWLEKQLTYAEANKESVYILSHIGPQVGPDYEDQWFPSYHKRFFDIVSRFDDTVKALLFGHTHNDMLGLLNEPRPSNRQQETMKTVFGNPGITTYDVTNPAFRVFKYNITTHALLDYENHFLDLNYIQTLDTNWNEKTLARYWEPQYTFTKTYQTEEFTDRAMNDIYYQMFDDLLLAKHYTLLMRNMVHYPPHAPDKAVCTIYRDESLCSGGMND